MPWDHFLTAIAFKVFGANLFVYRATHVLMGLGGIFAISLAYRSFLFPVLCTLFIPLVTNHHFAIELTSFHTLCFGLLLYSVKKKKHLGIILFTFLGVTSHIAFIAPLWALGVFIFINESPGRKALRTLRVLIFTLLPFFVYLFFSMPDKPNTIALIIGHLFLFFSSFKIDFLKKTYLTHQKLVFKIFIFLSLPFVFIFLLFTEGSWSVFIQKGVIEAPFLTGIGLFFLFLFIYKSRKNFFKEPLFQLFMLITVFTGVIARKPTPRYFEAAFLIFVLLLSRSFKFKKYLVLFFVFQTAFFILNYSNSKKYNDYKNREVNFLFLHDHTQDFSLKQKIANELKALECGYSQIEFDNPRISESFRFLMQNESTKNCPYVKLQIESSSQTKSGLKVFGFLDNQDQTKVEVVFPQR